MKDNWTECLAQILKSEGGYVDDPRDNGGATNFGVTKKTYENWVGREVTKEDIKNLTIDDVAPIYKERYWNRVRADELKDGCDLLLFDLSVHSGPRRSVKIAQQTAGTTVDGLIGPKTIAAINAMDQTEFIKKFSENRLEFYKRIEAWKHFENGFRNRVEKHRSLPNRWCSRSRRERNGDLNLSNNIATGHFGDQCFLLANCVNGATMYL